MSRAFETGKSLAVIGGSALGGLAPALALDPIQENVGFVQENYWAYPVLMLVLGAVLAWKGKPWMKSAGYGMVGAGAFALYRGYKSEAGNVYGGYGYGFDAGNVFGLPQDAGALPPRRYQHWAYPYANANAYNMQ